MAQLPSSGTEGAHGDDGIGLIRILGLLTRGMLSDQLEFASENLAMRQQLAALKHKANATRLRTRDRDF